MKPRSARFAALSRRGGRASTSRLSLFLACSRPAPPTHRARRTQPPNSAGPAPLTSTGSASVKSTMFAPSRPARGCRECRPSEACRFGIIVVKHVLILARRKHSTAADQPRLLRHTGRVWRRSQEVGDEASSQLLF
jgi:hypothetical protein